MIVKGNTFEANGPVYSITRQDLQSPYYTYLAKKTRSLFFYEEVELTVTNELEYLQNIAVNYTYGGLIDMPQT